MSTNTSISGLQAAQKNLGVISNNIANSSTHGFKRSDALFSELISSSMGVAESDAPGVASRLDSVRADFAQGKFEYTSNQLDLAIDGEGLFVVKDGPDTLYTRSGAFRVDNEGFVLTDSGSNLQGFAADANGEITAAITDLQITPKLIPQKVTDQINVTGNLDSRSEAPDPAVEFNIANPATYNFATSNTIYDSAGIAHQVNLYFAKDPAAGNTYNVYATVDDVLTGGQTQLEFDVNGVLTEESATALAVNFELANAEALEVTIDLSGFTGLGATSATSGVSQNGYPAGQLSGIQFDENGIAFASFTNGQTRAVGQVALATFANFGGLMASGDTTFSESPISGPATIGLPSIDGRGGIQPSALESSNVDLTVELLALIEAQRNFQSNAQAIQNQNEAADSIMQLR